MLDRDKIWSPARVVRVEKGDKEGTHVTVHYDGWADTFDERVLWTSGRLAPLFSFTKQVKCLVDILHKQKNKPRKAEMEELPSGARRTYCNLWPCTVQLRMPHPVVDGLEDEESCMYADEFLKSEENVFIKPYASHLLPQYVRDSNSHDDGRWINARRLRIWTDEPAKLGVLPRNFSEVYEIAKNDTETVGVLPMSAIEKGSLLNAIYRVHSRAGTQLRDGALYEASGIPERLMEKSLVPTMKPPEVVQIRNMEEDYQPLGPVPPPFLPPPIQITELIYHGCGVRRCKETGCEPHNWTASVCLGGNELFLGSFPTQTQAYQATRIAAGEDVEIETDLRKARLADLRAVPIEAVISATEKNCDPTVHDFSLHHYTMDQIRYEAYRSELEAKEQAENSFSEGKMESIGAAPPSQSPRKKRKGTPRKVDREKCCYMD